MIPNWIRTGLAGIALTIASVGCLTDKSYRAMLSLGPEGASAPVQELPPKDSAYVCMMTAQEFEKTGRVPEAIALYEKALYLQPNLEKKLARRMGILYDQAGQFSKSDEYFEKALAQNPKDADLLNDIGYSYYSRGKWAEAEEQLSKAVEFNPQHKRAWINLGMAIAQQNRYGESMRAFRKGATEAEALCNLGFVLAVQGKKEESLQAYKRAAEMAPGMRLAQAAVDRYSNPDLPRQEPAVEKVRAGKQQVSLPKPTPVAEPATLPPLKSKTPDEYAQPIVIDPDLESLPSRPARTQP